MVLSNRLCPKIGSQHFAPTRELEVEPFPIVSDYLQNIATKTIEIMKRTGSDDSYIAYIAIMLYYDIIFDYVILHVKLCNIIILRLNKFATSMYAMHCHLFYTMQKCIFIICRL